MAYLIIIMVVCVNMLVGYFGASAGYTVDGVARGFEATSEIIENGGSVGHDFIYYLTFGMVDSVSWDDWIQEPINDVVNFVGDNIGFIWDLSTFQIDNMPAFMSMIFLGINIIVAFIAIRTLRGVE